MDSEDSEGWTKVEKRKQKKEHKQEVTMDPEGSEGWTKVEKRKQKKAEKQEVKSDVSLNTLLVEAL